MQIVLLFPNGQRQNVLLTGVPRVGEYITLREEPAGAVPYEVVHVLWMETPDRGESAMVIVSVQPNGAGRSQ